MYQKSMSLSNQHCAGDQTRAAIYKNLILIVGMLKASLSLKSNDVLSEPSPYRTPGEKDSHYKRQCKRGGGQRVGVTWGDTRAADKGVSLETHTPKQATPWRESTQLPAHLQRRRSSSFHTLPAAAAQAMAAVELARAMAKQTQNEVATQQAKENRKKLSKTAAAENPVNV